MDTRALEELQALAVEDAELASRAAELRAADGAVATIRARAEELEAFILALPEREERTRSEKAAAQDELARRRDELADAEQQLAAAAGDDERAAAERVRARATDHVAVAQARVDRAAAETSDLERESAALPSALAELAAQAARVGEGAPGETPRELVDWASAAHASLFVAAGQLDARRERVIREANELATMLLGEPAYGATVAQALDRVSAAARTGSRSDP